MGRMAGGWSFHIILKMEAVVVVDAVETQTAMSVVNLVILLENVVCALVHEALVVVAAAAPVLDDVGVQFMGVGATALVEDVLHLVVVAATANHLLIGDTVVIHLMPMEIRC